MAEERRKNERLQIPGLKSNISDGRSAFFVVVDDISKTGVGVSQIPAGFDETVHKCFAVINAPLEDFKLVLNPRWVDANRKGKYKRIGFQIDDPPAEWVNFVEGIKSGSRKKNQRTDPRHKTFGLMAVVSDGTTKYFGVVEDLSANGLRLTQIPAAFDDAAGTCAAVVHSPTGDVKVSLHPCWIRSTKKGMYKTIGFQIHNPPEGWQELIDGLASENGQLSFLLLGNEEGNESDQDDEEEK